MPGSSIDEAGFDMLAPPVVVDPAFGQSRDNSKGAIKTGDQIADWWANS